MSLSVGQLLQIVSSGGTVGVLCICVYLFVTDRVVSRQRLLEMKQDRDDWKEMALSSTNTAERAVEVARVRRKDRGRDAVGS